MDVPELEVHELAQPIRDHLIENPTQSTVTEIADALDTSPELVRHILETHFVGEDGDVFHLGVGQGGGWIPEKNNDE